MSDFDIDDMSSASSVDTFAPVAVYRLKYYQPDSIFDQVTYMLIRPPRFVYNQKLLIPFRKYQQKYDYQVHNIPFPLSIYWAENPKYIILYLHGNSSSRFEGYLHLKQLPQGACLACFDFNGCGLRKDGKFITLGKQESIEVDKAVTHLQTYGYPIVGWGRSMGAVSLLMSSKCQIMIADSPFSSLYDLCKQTSINFVPSGLCCLVHCLFPCIFCCVRSGVQKKCGMDPNQLQIIKAVQNQSQKKSLLILAGTQDSMIHFSHAQRLHDGFRGENKRLILFEGTHNSNRPTEVFEECFNFIESAIQQNTPQFAKRDSDRIANPAQFQNTCKVLKISRSASKKSALNNQTSNISQNHQFQSSKQSLIPQYEKITIQLRPLRVGQKSSPKKLNKIQADYEISEEANFQIHQTENDIRTAIGQFQNDLHKQQNNMKGLSFKAISKKNEIESQQLRVEKQQKVLKPINQINQISILQKFEVENNIQKSDQLLDNMNSQTVPLLHQNNEMQLISKRKAQVNVENIISPVQRSNSNKNVNSYFKKQIQTSQQQQSQIKTIESDKSLLINAQKVKNNNEHLIIKVQGQKKRKQSALTSALTSVMRQSNNSPTSLKSQTFYEQLNLLPDDREPFFKQQQIQKQNFSKLQIKVNKQENHIADSPHKQLLGQKKQFGEEDEQEISYKKINLGLESNIKTNKDQGQINNEKYIKLNEIKQKNLRNIGSSSTDRQNCHKDQSELTLKQQNNKNQQLQFIDL